MLWSALVFASEEALRTSSKARMDRDFAARHCWVRSSVARHRAARSRASFSKSAVRCFNDESCDFSVARASSPMRLAFSTFSDSESRTASSRSTKRETCLSNSSVRSTFFFHASRCRSAAASKSAARRAASRAAFTRRFRASSRLVLLAISSLGSVSRKFASLSAASFSARAAASSAARTSAQMAESSEAEASAAANSAPSRRPKVPGLRNR
mmetsp:Transcript_58156/g.123508  ORF Transcript_58156/g.123508 Transcript_58156/m.123508 type:complete len:212 (-) Transcript_58156:1313-1948(-)